MTGATYRTKLPDLTGVPALTVRQPWAHAIAYCGKDVENRCWTLPDHVTRILVHAGKVSDPDGWATIRAFGFGLADIHPAGVPQSAIVAVANVAYVCDAGPRRAPCGCGRWAADGQYHWRLGTVWTLAKPVPCKGRQRLWYPAADVLHQVQTAGVLDRVGGAA